MPGDMDGFEVEADEKQRAAAAELDGRLREVALSRATPRDRAALEHFDLGFMLRVWVFIAWVVFSPSVVLAPVLALVALMKLAQGTFDPALWVLTGAFSVNAALFFGIRRWVGGRRRNREQAVLEGTLCTARVYGWRPALGLKLAMLQLDERVDCAIELPDGRQLAHSFKTSIPRMGRHLEAVGRVQALVHEPSGAVLLPVLFQRRVVLGD